MLTHNYLHLRWNDGDNMSCAVGDTVTGGVGDRKRHVLRCIGRGRGSRGSVATRDQGETEEQERGMVTHGACLRTGGMVVENAPTPVIPAGASLCPARIVEARSDPVGGSETKSTG
jgi:hypothetical protein